MIIKLAGVLHSKDAVCEETVSPRQDNFVVHHDENERTLRVILPPERDSIRDDVLLRMRC